MTRLTITTSDTELIITNTEGQRLHSFGTKPDERPFADWSVRYANAQESLGDLGELLAIGKEMYAWLHGSKWLTSILDQAAPPLIIDFQVKRRSSPDERAFLEAPWELLADEGGPLALDARILYCPVRRIGPASEPVAPSEYRLNTVFMAASPRHGGPELDYEWEESQILHLHEDRTLNMDLIVEETGNLGQLVDTVSQVKPVDVVHLSCHGNIHNQTGEPFLALESEFGDQELVTAAQLTAAYSANQPSLLFLSACKTSEKPEVPEQDRDSLTAHLVQRGFRAVLGWSGSVKDRAASKFASKLYQDLSVSGTLEKAVAQARLELRPDPQQDKTDSRPDWHLARLYLGPKGGNILATAEQQRTVRDAQEGTKAFLDERNKDVPVANRREFVGRRREIQKILKVLRKQEKAGVLIHAIGNQGKSSLAARVANRLHEHRTVLIYGKAGQEHYYLPHHVLEKLKAANNDAVNYITELQQKVEQGNTTFLTAMKTLLEEHFSGIKGQPKVLLVVDDLEKNLEVVDGTRYYQVKKDYQNSLAGIITAFGQAKTESRLIITSRHTFQLNDTHGVSVADHLHALPLPSFQDKQAIKQYHAKYTSEATGEQQSRPDLGRVVKACHGNPGLQDLIIRMFHESKETYEKALKSLEALDANQQETDENPEQLAEFLADLAVEHLLDLLSRGEMRLIQIARNFDLPVPTGVWDALAETLALENNYANHLLGLGVLERFEDLADPKQDAYWFNRLVGLRVKPEENVPKELSQIIGQTLQTHWTLENTSRLSWTLDEEVTKWGLLAEDPTIADYATRAVEGLFYSQLYQASYNLGSKVIGFLKQIGEQLPPDLLLETAQSTELLGYVNEALNWFIAAQKGYEEDGNQRLHAIATGYIARIKLTKGDIEEAQALHESVLPIYEELGDKYSKAVTMGLIARIKVAKGAVDEGLSLHESVLLIYEELESKRDIAIAMGDIARIKTGKGEVGEALGLHESVLRIFEELGSKRDIAIAMGDIARIKSDKGEVGEALTLHESQMKIFEELGDKRFKAIAMGDIALIKKGKGEVDEALVLLESILRTFRELDSKRDIAITMGDIARIKVNKGATEEALALHESVLCIYEELNSKRDMAIAMGDIARIKMDKGAVKEALALHENRLLMLKDLGDQRSQANAMGDIARIRTKKGDVSEALALHQQAMTIYSELGDKRSIAVTMGDIAEIMLIRESFEDALSLYESSLKVIDELKDIRLRSSTLQRMAFVLLEQNQLEAAFPKYLESFQIAVQLGDAYGIAFVGETLGQILWYNGAQEDGRKVLEMSMAAFMKLGMQEEVANIQKLLAGEE